MNEKNRLRVREVFSQAAELPPEDRPRFLEAACGGDAELRAEVECLLEYDSGFEHGKVDEGFLKSPVVRPQEPTTIADPTALEPFEPRMPPQIGHFRMIRRHGEGGMGTVYEAEQDNPRRTVALKVIRSELVSPEMVKRFKHEAHILARLQHPGIAQVHEAGLSEDGRPYLAMEFISGMPLDEFARSNHLGPKARLELMAKVCDAVQHAHDKGVVHRDLKPVNILVDKDGQPKVLDFGVAHVTATDVLATSSQTRTGQLLGTLSYMSPEQLHAHSKELDGRSDVYTLGVILFELLAGRLPYAIDRLPLHEVARVIEQEEPSRLGTINKFFRGDIEIVVAKSLEKDRNRRYQSAKDLASDIRRNLRGEAIQARKVGTVERSWRWSRRNPFIAGLSAVLVTLLVLTTIASLVVADRMSRLAINERKSRADAQVETYNAVLSEVRALRAGPQPGWRAKSLHDLARLAVMPTLRRDLPQLRTEATASLAVPDILLASRIELPAADLSSLIFSEDGRTLITAGNQSSLDFWDLTEKRHIRTTEGIETGGPPGDKVLPLPDGKGLVIATSDRGVIVTDLQGKSLRRTPITRWMNRPKKVQLAADGKRIAIAWNSGAGITVHDLDTGGELASFPDVPFALSPDGTWLALSQNDDIVMAPVGGKKPRVVLGRRAGAYSLAFNPKGTMLAAAFTDHSTVLWNTSTREQFDTLRGHRERVLDVAFSPDGEWIATASLDYTVRIWETRTGQNIATLPVEIAVRRVQWSPTGEYLASSTDASSTILLYQIHGRHRVQRWLVGHTKELACVAAHPQRGQIATSAYSELLTWDLTSPRPTSVSIGPDPGWGTGMAYSLDGELLATSSWIVGKLREVLVRETQTGLLRDRFTVPEVIQDLAFDRQGKRLACGDAAGNMFIRDLGEHKNIGQFATGSRIWSIFFLDDARLITHGKESVFIFNVETGQQERVLDLGGGTIQRFLVDRERRRLVVGFEDGAIENRSLPDLTQGLRLEAAHGGAVLGMALSPDGKLLATAGADHLVVLRDSNTIRPFLNFPAWSGTLRELTFDFDGRHLAVVGSNSDVELWDLKALRDDLTPLGLDWDQPATILQDRTSLRKFLDYAPASVAIMRREGQADPEAVREAASRISAGIQASAGRRWGEAIDQFEQAAQRFRGLSRANPTDGLVADRLGISLICLGGALARENRTDQARAVMQEARKVFEAISHPSPGILYNTACAYAVSFSMIDGDTARQIAEREALAKAAVQTLRRAIAAGWMSSYLLDNDTDLDSLRARPDFRELLLDRDFPADPFARP